MIDVSQLTSLISAFRVETEKESISPETVGKLLQDIVDLLATASTGQELQVLDAWKTMLSQYVVVYDVEDANITDPQILFLKFKGLSLRNGSKYTSGMSSIFSQLLCVFSRLLFLAHQACIFSFAFLPSRGRRRRNQRTNFSHHEVRGR